jgi:superfamily II DNA or RNA helicase
VTRNSPAEEPFDLYGTTLADLGDIADEWDAEVNGRQASDVEAFDATPATWRCTISSKHPAWTMTVLEAVALPESSPRCPTCRGEGVNVRSISIARPDLAPLLHPGAGDPATISISAAAEVLWLCGEMPEHEPYVMSPRSRAVASGNPCPSCYGPTTRWTEERLIAFVRDLDPTSPELGPAQLFAVCQQNGLLRTRRGTLITNALIRGEVSELNSLLGGALLSGTEASSPDISPSASATPATAADSGADATLEAPLEGEEPTSGDHALPPDTGADPDQAAAGLDEADDDTGSLPDVSTGALLARLGRMVANCDEETADYLAASAVRALWDKAYELDRLENTETEAAAERIASLRADLSGAALPENAFAETIWERFSAEREAALELVTPANWAFTPVLGGPVAMPNLMQRHVATMVRDRRRYGNWSGTGAGKTVSAVLGARLIEAGVTGISLVVCPNNTVDGWAAVVRNCFRDARVATKTLSPVFGAGDGHRWLILNYDMLPGNEGSLRKLIETYTIDMLTIDEVHFVKHRSKSEMSQRRQVLTGISSAAAALKPNLGVLGLSATPVVNDLHEARSLLEIIEGEALADVGVAPTINDAMSIHQRIVRAGTRWMPTYAATLDIIAPRIEIGHIAEDLRGLGRAATPLQVERLLVEAKMAAIVEEAVATRSRGKRTLIYTQFLDGIIQPLTDALNRADLRVGHFTGSNKEGLAQVRGLTAAGESLSAVDQVDVIIGSEAVGTGVDGLQHVCDTLIFATLPWTHAAYMQIVGRVHRQGQDADRVRVVIPATYIEVSDAGDLTTWSWDDKAWGRIRNKQTLADCAVDGVVPSREMGPRPGRAVAPTVASPPHGRPVRHGKPTAARGRPRQGRRAPNDHSARPPLRRPVAHERRVGVGSLLHHPHPSRRRPDRVAQLPPPVPGRPADLADRACARFRPMARRATCRSEGGVPRMR